jgi:hypothetical protein
VLNELNDEATDGAKQERVDKAALSHPELQDEPDDEETQGDVIKHLRHSTPLTGEWRIVNAELLFGKLEGAKAYAISVRND